VSSIKYIYIRREHLQSHRDKKANEAYRGMVQTQLLINKKPGYDSKYGNANMGV
jgi:hypothetical protein